jgi:hypothetical protein
MAISASNLKWFLSGGASNSDPTLSIGGAKSSVALSPTPLHNLFDRVTGDEAASGVTRYRLLYFQNTDTDSDGLLEPIVLYFTAVPTNGDTLKAGLATQGKSSVVTAIANENTAPAGVSFTAPTTKSGSTLVLPSPPYLEGAYHGVWFEHVVPTAQSSSAGITVSWVMVGDTV